LLLDVATPEAETAFVIFDIAPERLAVLRRLDRDADVRAALASPLLGRPSGAGRRDQGLTNAHAAIRSCR
jgi:hypothetical protein